MTRFFSFCIVVMVGSIVRADDLNLALRNRFLAAVPQTVKKLKEISFEAKCVVTQDYQTISEAQRATLRKSKIDSDKMNVIEFRCAVRGTSGFVTGIDRQGIEFVKVKNSEYAFMLKRSPRSKNQSYSLSLLERLGASSIADQQIEDAAAEYASSALRTFYFSTETVARIIESPTFRIHKVAIVKVDDAELVRIEFDRLLSDPLKRSFSYSDAFLVCDPERYWTLKEYGCAAFDGAVIFRTTIKCGESVQGFPIPETITHLTSSPDDPTVSRSVITVGITRKDVPREEFYLSHYGLPEPTFQRRWFGTWAWYLIAGTVCLAVAMIITKRRRARLA